MPIQPLAAELGKIYTLEAKVNDGTVRRLSQYRGQALLIVNTASRCGFTPQYEGLEELHRRYVSRGLRVLGFPSNEFGAQEPGTDADIQQFCKLNYGVSFDLFAKISVNGDGAHPLYRLLTSESPFPGPIEWNFTKFLVGRDGSIAARFGPDDAPLSVKVVAKVEALLA